MTKLKIKKLTPDAILPTQAHKGDMFDLYANKDITINSFESTIVPLGIAMEIPEGYRVKVFSRSSLPIKKGIMVSNSVGIIDNGYRNEIGLICVSIPKQTSKKEEVNGNMLCSNFKLENNPIEIKKGDKIAQFQLEKIEDFEIEEVEDLDMSNDRGGGFGSTGTN